MIKIEALTFYYSDAAQPALKDISLEVRDGEFVLLTGPSGGGKSSLCRCLNGLIPHFYGGKISGRVMVGGLDTLKSSTRELAAKVGFVFQDPENQLVSMDVEREIAFGLENLAFSRDLIAKRIEESLDTIGIAGLRYRSLSELSGGEKQKVAIASVLALHPDILILDEPTSELDPKGAEEVLSVITRLNDELGLTVILVEHRLDRVLQYADRLIILDGGKAIIDGGIRDVMAGRYRELAASGIGIPPLIRLFQELKSRDPSLSQIPLTVKEGRAMLRQTVKDNASSENIRPYNKEMRRRKPVINVKRLWHAYPNGLTALKNVSLKIGEGEFVAIMGRNASGKTTLAKHFNRLLTPTKGAVEIDGVDTGKATVAELARKVGFVFQNPDHQLFADSVWEEASFAARNFGALDGATEARTGELLARCGLGDRLDDHPYRLSYGQKRRLNLVSVLSYQPKLVLLDEVLIGQDPENAAFLLDLLWEHVAGGGAVIMVSHAPEITNRYASRLLFFEDGGVLIDAPVGQAVSQLAALGKVAYVA